VAVTAGQPTQDPVPDDDIDAMLAEQAKQSNSTADE
jgi:hypothetical protein